MVLAHDIKEIERTQDIHIAVDVTFESMLLKRKTLAGLKRSGFYKPSPIQLHGIPLGKCGFDLFLEAKSGTGKTAVFTVIALEKLDIHKNLQSIILAPTREIAAQISDVIKQIGSMYKDINVEVVMGGLPIEEDIKKLKENVHILVGSPGRMRHLIQGNYINVSAVRLLVLDEADKLMDKSFQSDINYIFSVLPKQKQVIMSSATYPETLKSLMQNYVQKAQHVCPDSTTILLGIKQLVTTVKCHHNIVRQTQTKFNELLKILTQREFKQCLIFCNYQVRVVELCKMLINAKWPAEQLHGQLEQTDRLDALKTLQDYKCRILVSTDLAARGIDASNVDLVINFEPPYEWQTYLHRIGRAGRFGSYGAAITILSEGKEISKFKEMMGSIDSSLNLKNLWDNKKFELVDLHNTCSSLELDNYVSEEELCNAQEMSYEQRHKKILAKTNCKKDECDITEFSKLFENSKESKIESFNDLLASLKHHELSDHKENKIVDINCTTHCDEIFNKDTKSNQILHQSNDHADLVLETNRQNDICSENEETKLDMHKERTTTLSKNHSEKQIINTQDNLYLINNVTSNIQSSHNALIDAGLPTCFSSTKHSTKTRVVQKIPNKVNVIKKSDKRSKAFDYMKKQESGINISKGKYNDSNNRTDSFNIDVYKIRSDILRPIKHVPRQNQIIENSCTENNRFIKREKYYDAHNVSCDSYKKYMAWYNQVKIYVNQIEMCSYIYELSKI